MENHGFLKGALGGVVLGVVILFLLVGAPTWSQGFLSQTTSATGGQAGAQNQAAQSSISIETAKFVVSSETITLVIRNVGAIPVALDSIIIAGFSSNAGFQGKILVVIVFPAIVASDGTAWTLSPSDGSAYANVPKGSSVTAILIGPASPATTALKPGDLVNVKVTTTVGTFAQAQFTVPSS